MSDATPVHAENARLRKNRVFEPYPEATHLVRLDDAEDAVRRAFAAGRADAEQRVIDRLAREAGEPPYKNDTHFNHGRREAWREGAACGVAASEARVRELAEVLVAIAESDWTEDEARAIQENVRTALAALLSEEEKAAQHQRSQAGPDPQ